MLDEELVDFELPGRLVIVISEFEAVPEPDLDPTARALAELEASRARWLNRWFGSYTFELTLHDLEAGSMEGPYLVVVLAGGIESVTLNGQLIEPDLIPELAIDQLFDLVKDQIRSGRITDVLYHEELGYPVFVTYGREGESLSVGNVLPYR